MQWPGPVQGARARARRELDALLAALEPRLDPSTYAFCSVWRFRLGTAVVRLARLLRCEKRRGSASSSNSGVHGALTSKCRHQSSIRGGEGNAKPSARSSRRALSEVTAAVAEGCASCVTLAHCDAIERGVLGRAHDDRRSRALAGARRPAKTWADAARRLATYLARTRARRPTSAYRPRARQRVEPKWRRWPERVGIAFASQTPSRGKRSAARHRSRCGSGLGLHRTSRPSDFEREKNSCPTNVFSDWGGQRSRS